MINLHYLQCANRAANCTGGRAIEDVRRTITIKGSDPEGLTEKVPMESTIPKEDSFYILATDSSADEVTRVLKDGETFAVFDRHGDI